MEQKQITKISKYSEEELQLYAQTEDLMILHKLKLYSDDLYYNTGKSSGLEDWQYDIIKETLNERDPNYVVPIGVKIRQHENRVKLPYWLGSMSKMSTQAAILFFYKDVEEKVKADLGDDATQNTITERVKELWELLSKTEQSKYRKIAVAEFERDLATWIAHNKASDYTIEDKLDGVSCLMVMKNGKIKLYTRGDGNVGADISYLAQYFTTIPKGLTETISVRGELIMKESVFKKNHVKDHANPRNLVAGRIGAKTIRKGLKDIDFVAYEIVGDEEMQKPSEQLEYLDTLGFTTVRREVIPNFTVESLMETLVRFKESSPYEIDGIIVQPDSPYERNASGNPEYAFAFKMRMTGNFAEVTVISVEWNISKWGLLKPRIEYNPTMFGGAELNWATGFNAKYIVENSIGHGAIVKVTRSGDVIPYILSVVKPAAEPEMPEIPYKWNESGVDIYTEEYGDEMCVKLIDHFFTKLGIKQVGEKRVEKIYKTGYDSLLKIIAASQKDLMEVPGFGSRLATLIHTNIHNGLKNLSLPLVLGSSGVFGFGLGRKKITTLMDDFPDILDVYKTMSSSELLARVLQVEGFATKTAQKIVDNVNWADKFITALKHFATFKKKVVVGDSLKGVKAVFTGGKDKNLEEQIVVRGGKVATSVSKNTTVVIIGGPKPGGKLQKAKNLGIEILEKQAFIQKYIMN
jgi:DNA ligase (NAD+)